MLGLRPDWRLEDFTLFAALRARGGEATTMVSLVRVGGGAG